MRVRLFATDVDGTITESRSSFRLCLDAVIALRRLEEKGVTVSLVTGNNHEVAAGLARYIGASGPVIAENGCVVFWRGEVESLCSGRPPEEVIEALLSLGLRESWQNRCRLHDLAFLASSRDALAEAAREARRIAGKLGWNGRIIVSGYALHVQPAGGGKGNALRVVASRLGVKPEGIVAVGDSEGDVELLEAAGLPAAVGDADPEVKRVARIVASRPAGRGLAEIVEALLP